MEGKIRRPAVAGQFYAGSQKQLLADVAGCYESAKDIRPKQRVQAVIVPHAGYVFSGATAASAFSCIDPSAQYEHIFLLGPSHHVWLDKASVGVGYDAYNTPLGNVKVDYAGSTNSYLNNTHIRTYSNGTTLKFTAPEGYVLTGIDREKKEYVSRLRLRGLSRYILLIAKAALMRAAVMRYKNRNIALFNNPSAPMPPGLPAARLLFCFCRRPCR